MASSLDDRTTASLSWLAQMQHYLLHAPCLSPASEAERKKRSEVVLENPMSAEAWWEFLRHEDTVHGATKHSGSGPASSAPAADGALGGSGGGAGLYHLFHRATELIQRSKGKPVDAYVHIWLGYARHQWRYNEDDARDTLKTLRNQLLGNSNAHLYRQWAVLEAQSGNAARALGILSKGLKEGAQPSSLLDELRVELQTNQSDAGQDASHTGAAVASATTQGVSAAARGLPCVPPLPSSTFPDAAMTQRRRSPALAAPAEGTRGSGLEAAPASGDASNGGRGPGGEGAAIPAHPSRAFYRKSSEDGTLGADQQRPSAGAAAAAAAAASDLPTAAVEPGCASCLTSSAAALFPSSALSAWSPTLPPAATAPRTTRSTCSRSMAGSSLALTLSTMDATTGALPSNRSSAYASVGSASAEEDTCHCRAAHDTDTGETKAPSPVFGVMQEHSGTASMTGVVVAAAGGPTGGSTAAGHRAADPGVSNGTTDSGRLRGDAGTRPEQGHPDYGAALAEPSARAPAGPLAPAPAATAASSGHTCELTVGSLQSMLAALETGGGEGTSGAPGQQQQQHPAGIRKFGFKTKALRVTKPAGAQAGAGAALSLPEEAVRQVSASVPAAGGDAGAEARVGQEGPGVQPQAAGFSDPGVGASGRQPTPLGSLPRGAGARDGREEGSSRGVRKRRADGSSGRESEEAGDSEGNGGVAKRRVAWQEQAGVERGVNQGAQGRAAGRQVGGEGDAGAEAGRGGLATAGAQEGGAAQAPAGQSAAGQHQTDDNGRVAASAVGPAPAVAVSVLSASLRVRANANALPPLPTIPASFPSSSPSCAGAQSAATAAAQPQAQQQLLLPKPMQGVELPGHGHGDRPGAGQLSASAEQALRQSSSGQGPRDPPGQLPPPPMFDGRPSLPGGGPTGPGVSATSGPGEAAPVGAAPDGQQGPARASGVATGGASGEGGQQAGSSSAQRSQPGGVPSSLTGPWESSQPLAQPAEGPLPSSTKAQRQRECGPSTAEQQRRQDSGPQGQAQQQQQQGQTAVPQPQCPPGEAPSVSPRGPPPERLPEPQRQAMEDQQWVYVHGIRYQKLDCVGRGGSSKVFKVLACNRQIYALKRVRLTNKDPEAIQGFIDEIALLKQLRNTPNIIQLINAQVFREQGLIYMVLEYGDIDLARLLHNHEEARRKSGGKEGQIDENFIRLYWQQMLQAVRGIHDMRIVHSDLKPANFLLVQGQLKLIDFGIARSIQGDTTSINRESQVGTLNYMSPEAIQGGASNPLGGPPQKVGRASDVWSLGCILYQMVYGRTPFADLPFIPKMNAICNPSHVVSFAACSNPYAIDVMRRCLDRDPRTRSSIQELLDHEFLHPERASKHASASSPSDGVQHPAAAATAGMTLGSMSLGQLGLTEEQLKRIVTQVASASVAGAPDIDSLTRQVLLQLRGAGEAARGAGGAQTEPA